MGISINDFSFWLLSIDIFEKEPNLDWYSEGQEASCKNLSFYNRRSQCCSSRGVPTKDLKETDNFRNISYHLNSFLFNNVLTSFANLKKSTVTNTLIPTTGKNFFKAIKKIQNELVVKSAYSSIFRNAKSIFSFSEYYGAPRAPLLIYLSPYDSNPFGDTPQEFEKKIGAFVKQFSHPTAWTIIDDYVLSPIGFSEYPWDGVVFIDTKKYRGGDGNIHLPVFIDYLVKQIACYYWLKIRYEELKKMISQILRWHF